MARTTANGRVSVSPTEREVITTTFAVLQHLLKEGGVDGEWLEDELVRNLDYSQDIDYPPELAYGRDMSNEAFAALEAAREDHRRELSLQAFVDTAADFGVRLELAELNNRKW